MGSAALRLCVVLILALPALCLPALSFKVAAAAASSASRLPAMAAPLSYQIRIEPDLTQARFKGEETLTLDVLKPTSEIIMNAADLQISEAYLTWPPGVIRPRIEMDEKREQLRLILPNQIGPGKCTLTLSFRGILNNKLRGFYLAHYDDEKGSRHSIAATQMEPTDARRMFPCFDEPALKATYRIKAVIDPDLTAISNAPVESESIDPASHKKVVAFAATPKMSTYLVALIVGKFEATRPQVSAAVPITVWTVPGKSKMGVYAQQFAVRLMPYFNDYFGIPYPARKLDLIAIPDFEAGAMENLGAITFRETLLLVDEKTASTQTKQNVASVLAHEVAHMWFGDLVTMLWWDDLWLNEAFATWMATKAVDHLIPQWRCWDHFAKSRAWSLNTDALRSTRAIHFPVANPEQANEMFDEITYSKGASILRMLEMYVGERRFQEGVNRYLTRHAFGGARGDDLWEAIGKVSRLPVLEMMHGWINQPGFPLLAVRQSAGGRELSVTQQRFLLEGTGKADAALWYVPVRAAYLRPAAQKASERSHQAHLLKARSATLAAAPAARLLNANEGACGYYRVLYAPEQLKAVEPLIQSRLSPAERLGLLSDEFALAVAGLTPVSRYLSLTSRYSSDPDPYVTTTFIQQLGQLFSYTEANWRPDFERFVRGRLGPARAKLGWVARADEPDLVRILRGKVLETLGTIGQDKETIDEARRLFNLYLKDPASVDPNLVDAITGIVAYNGDNTDYERIRQCWVDAPTPEVEERNLMALASFRLPELVNRTLKLCLGDDVRIQDQAHLLSALLGNDESKVAAWNFIKQNWQELLKTYPMNMVPHVVSATSSLSLPEQAQDLERFLRTHPVPAGRHAVARTLERVHINVRFRQRCSKEMRTWLQRHFAHCGAGVS